MRALALLDGLRLEPIGNLSRYDQLEILRIRNQTGVRNNMYTNHIIGEAEHLAWIERLEFVIHTRFFAVFTENTIIGGVSLNSISAENRRADWAFYLDETTRGKGLGSALEFKFLDYAFSDCGFQKLNCEVLEFNKPVFALHKRFGFVEEGFRRNHILRDGEAWGAHFLGITKDEWGERRAEIVDPTPRDGSYYLGIINQIEQLRGKNNKNWMDLLRLSFLHAPNDAANIVAEIYNEDQGISALARKLVNK